MRMLGQAVEGLRMVDGGDARHGAGEARAPSTPLAVLALVTSIAYAAMAYFAAAVWVWLAVSLWFLFVLVAILAHADPPSRKYIAGTLRKSTFTQIYTVLAKRLVMGLWARLCDPVDDDAPPWAVFRAALTWRLYDRALLIAVAYPILLPVLWWLGSGQDATLGAAVLLEGTGLWDVWPERAGVLGAFLPLSAGIMAGKLGSNSRRRVAWKAPDWVELTALTFAFASSFAVIAAAVVATAGGLLAATVLLGAYSVALLATITGAREGAPAVVVLAGAAVINLAEGTGAGVGALALGFTAIVVGGAAAGWLERSGRPRRVRFALTLILPGLWIAMVAPRGFQNVAEFDRSIFLLLGIFPLINALFDVLSYAATLTLIRVGLRARLPVLYGLADLAVALVLFLGLGAALTLTVAALNALAGTPLLDLGALFAGIRADGHAYWWLYAMIFSTIVPTALHGLLSLFGLQGLTPRPIRRRVAGWIDATPTTPWKAVAAPFVLGAIWAVPLIAIAAALLALWHGVDDAAKVLGLLYLTGLESLAGWGGAL